MQDAARKFGEARGVGLEVRRKLKEQRAEFAGLANRFEHGDEMGDVGFAVAQALEVRDALRSLEAEAEEVGRCGQPAFEHRGGREGAEGVVDLDRVELGGVELEEALRGGACRDRSQASRWDRPSRRFRRKMRADAAVAAVSEEGSAVWVARGKVIRRCSVRVLKDVWGG